MCWAPVSWKCCIFTQLFFFFLHLHTILYFHLPCCCLALTAAYILRPCLLLNKVGNTEFKVLPFFPLLLLVVASAPESFQPDHKWSLKLKLVRVTDKSLVVLNCLRAKPLVIPNISSCPQPFSMSHISLLQTWTYKRVEYMPSPCVHSHTVAPACARNWNSGQNGGCLRHGVRSGCGPQTPGSVGHACVSSCVKVRWTLPGVTLQVRDKTSGTSWTHSQCGHSWKIQD